MNTEIHTYSMLCKLDFDLANYNKNSIFILYNYENQGEFKDQGVWP
jgi:hypothetical protein